MVNNSSERSDDNLVNSVDKSHTTIIKPVKSFALQSNTQFACRASDVFQKLGSLEQDHTTWMSLNETYESFEVNNNAVENSSELSVFKKPFMRASSNRRAAIPYKRNMKKWVKYSLKDIPLSSDASNAAVAFQFLDELRRKKEEKIQGEVLTEDGKVMFRKNVRKTAAVASLLARKDNANSSVPYKSSGSVVKLDHLQDD